MQCLGAICTGKGAGSWEPGAEAYYASDLEPAVLDTERTWSTAQELKRQLSTLPGGQAARGVAWGGAGPGGLSSLESRASNGQGLAPAAFVPTRLQSIPAEQQRGRRGGLLGIPAGRRHPCCCTGSSKAKYS